MTIKHQEALQDRARDLEAKGFNGLKLVLVRLPGGAHPSEAYLELHFHNTLGVTEIRQTLVDQPDLAKSIFPIAGGHRLLAGAGSEEVKTIGVTDQWGNDFLELKVAPVGDYSTYTLSLDTTHLSFKNIDPLFSELAFKFRPGCFSLDCAPTLTPGQAPPANPMINYLAKDYESFRHTLIAGMMQRVPNWQPTSEADLDLVLLELFSAAADELSDYQDRVMNEAYLTSARKRVSLARHTRLMDYHIHPGHQASTTVALELLAGYAYEDPLFSAGLKVWTGAQQPNDQSQVFLSPSPTCLHWWLNQMALYTWSNVQPALAAGSTQADLELCVAGEVAAKEVERLIRQGLVTRLLIQEWKNPDTGAEAGRNPEKRQLLNLLPGTDGAEAKYDPVEDKWFVRVRWEPKDQLKYNYCFVIKCEQGDIPGVSAFHGNLLDVFHGQSNTFVFKAPNELLTEENQFYYEVDSRRGTRCFLATHQPLAYTFTPPGNEVGPKSTLKVEVDSSSIVEVWGERISLIHSRENDKHFVVETDEIGRSLIRFGNGINGQALPDDAIVTCTFQTGQALAGNIGADTLVYWDAASQPEFAAVAKVWNPLDVTNGQEPEPVAEIVRRVQEAYRYRQLRAITEDDYVRRAEELPEVSKAAAYYTWTGTWRAVRVIVDPQGQTELLPETREKIARHLDAVRLIGDDIEIRLPRYVPLRIEVSLCVHPDFWPEDVRFWLEQEFSDSYTADGRMGFFHPDAWTFGQPLYVSQILGRIQAITGVDHVMSVDMWRWNEATPGSETDGVITVQDHEIILVKNDPDHMETGMITFDVQGGRH